MRTSFFIMIVLWLRSLAAPWPPVNIEQALGPTPLGHPPVLCVFVRSYPDLGSPRRHRQWDSHRYTTIHTTKNAYKVGEGGGGVGGVRVCVRLRVCACARGARVRCMRAYVCASVCMRGYPSPVGSPAVFTFMFAASQVRTHLSTYSVSSLARRSPLTRPCSASQSASSLPGTLMCDRTCLSATSPFRSRCSRRHSRRV